MASYKRPSEAMVDLLKRAGSVENAVAAEGRYELSKALTLPLQQGVLKGDILSNIFEPIYFAPGTAVEFPLDFLAPGTEKDHVAFTVPSQGRIPERHVDGDFVTMSTYEIASTIDFPTKYLRDARWDVLERAQQVIEGGFIRKMNDDGWRTIMAAAVNRGVVIYDDAAAAGLFTKRLISLMKISMRRNAGGNSTSVNRGKLTDIYLSPEALEDIRSWDLTQVDDTTRRELYMAPDGASDLTKIFGVFLHDLDELGVGQAYDLYAANVLGGTKPGSKLEFLFGLDLSKNDSFVSPYREVPTVYTDDSTYYHRQRRMSMYGWGEIGFGLLDNRRVLIGVC